MVIKLYGSPQSTCTRRAAVVFKEVGIPYELVEVDIMAGAHKAEKYLADFQPFGQVPVLVSASIAFLLL